MSTIVVQNLNGTTAWQDAISAALGEFAVVAFDDEHDPLEVTHVVMWRLPADTLASYSNLEAILMMGAGFDHLDLPALPDVPIVRLIDPAMADDIALYALSWVIFFQRDFDVFRAAESTPTWVSDRPTRFPRDVTVGVLGSGAIGGVVLETCAQHGFVTLAWSRSNHDRPMVDFFAACDVVVNLVPLSGATHGLVGPAELEALGDGVLINAGRGPTVDTDALIAALDGELRAAVLDVFDTEPLPADSPLWQRTDVYVTPHIAGNSDPVTAAPIIADSIATLRSGAFPAATINR